MALEESKLYLIYFLTSFGNKDRPTSAKSGQERLGKPEGTPETKSHSQTSWALCTLQVLVELVKTPPS